MKTLLLVVSVLLSGVMVAQTPQPQAIRFDFPRAALTEQMIASFEMTLDTTTTAFALSTLKETPDAFTPDGAVTYTLPLPIQAPGEHALIVSACKPTQCSSSPTLPLACDTSGCVVKTDPGPAPSFPGGFRLIFFNAPPEPELPLDTFDRVDALTLGVNWTEVYPGFQILSNRAQPRGPNAARHAAFYSAVPASPNQWAQSKAACNPYIWGLGVRMSQGPNGLNGYVLMGGDGMAGLRLFRFLNGAQSEVVALSTAPGAVQPDDVFRLEANVSILKVFKRGAEGFAQVGADITDDKVATGQWGIYGLYSVDCHEDFDAGDLP